MKTRKATKRRNIAVYAKEPSCPEEPCAGKPHAGICEGGTEQSVSLPRLETRVLRSFTLKLAPKGRCPGLD
jgi:hypothetical protein